MGTAVVTVPELVLVDRPTGDEHVSWPRTNVFRGPLVGRLQAATERVVTITAPPGYGKSTLVAQWIDADARPSRWLTVDEDCNDALVLASRICVTLGIEHDNLPGPGAVFESLSWSIEYAAASGGPTILVLDDAHLLSGAESLRVIGELLAAWPSGAPVVLVGDHRTRLPLAEVRAAGNLLDIGALDLRFDADEAQRLLEGPGLDDLADADVDEILDATEGWPMGVAFLAAERRHNRKAAFDEPVPSVVSFLRPIVDALPLPQQRFLVETSLVEELSGPLCDALLDASGSGETLEELERAGVMVVPLDRQRERYRYHRMLRQALRGALDERTDSTVPTLCARAADWFEQQGMIDRAIETAMASDQVDIVAGLLQRHAVRVLESGGPDAVMSWLAWLEDHATVDRYPLAAAIGGLCLVMTGDADGATRWLDAAARTGRMDGETEAARLIALALVGAGGVAQIERDASRSVSLLRPGSPLIAVATLTVGMADALRGRTEKASESFARAAECAIESSMHATGSAASSSLALLHLGAGDLAGARDRIARARRAIDTGHLVAHPIVALTDAVEAWIELLSGSCGPAKLLYARASQGASSVRGGPPPLAIETNLLLTTCALGLGDGDAAQRWLSDAVLAFQRRNLGTLTEACRGLQTELALLTASGHGPPSFTPAEVRLIAPLATYASFRQIGADLFVSPHTVKTQAISIYRKLGVTSRGDAVARMERLGLLVRKPD